MANSSRPPPASVERGHGRGFIAVHVGAGFHSPANSDLYKNICNQACLQAIALLRKKKSAIEAVKAAIVMLENSPSTNAGSGSNLTLDGTVECDASIMDGASLQYGAVGAVSGIKNPILVADDLLQTQLQGNMSLGRIPPSTLVGDGAYKWAKKQNIPTVDKESLITESSRRSYVKHKRKIDSLEEFQQSAARSKRAAKGKEHHAESYDKLNARGDSLQDTVGAISVDEEGNVVSAVSSGGILLKQPGRVGQAAMYGCGCWAENDPAGKVGVGVSTTGSGELLIKTLLARECAECLKTQQDPTMALSSVFADKFLASPLIRHARSDQKLAGTLAVKVDSSDSSQLDVEVLWAHTSDSMCLAYMSTHDSKPAALISRLPEGKLCGQSFVLQSKCCTLKL